MKLKAQGIDRSFFVYFFFVWIKTVQTPKKDVLSLGLSYIVVFESLAVSFSFACSIRSSLTCSDDYVQYCILLEWSHPCNPQGDDVLCGDETCTYLGLIHTRGRRWRRCLWSSKVTFIHTYPWCCEYLQHVVLISCLSVLSLVAGSPLSGLSR